jgi:hypothetical protein
MDSPSLLSSNRVATKTREIKQVNLRRTKYNTAVSNNAGVETAKTFFISMAYCPGALGRAVAFAAISMICQDGQRN